MLAWLAEIVPDATIDLAVDLNEAHQVLRSRTPNLCILRSSHPEAVLDFLQDLQGSFPSANEVGILLLMAREVLDVTPPHLLEMLYGFDILEDPPGKFVFQAAARRLVMRSSRADNPNFTATIRRVHLFDIIQLKCSSRDSALLIVTGLLGRQGYVHILQGEVCYAAIDDRTGLDALAELLSWRRGDIQDVQDYEDPRPNIEGGWQGILMEAVRRNDEAFPQMELPLFHGEQEETRFAEAPVLPEGHPVIMLVDDAPLVLQFVDAVLRDHMPEAILVTVETGGEVLQAAQYFNPSLILLDYILPDMMGGDVCDMLLSDPSTSQIPVILVSGGIQDFEPLRVGRPNITASLAKPFYPPQLVALVRQHLSVGLAD